MRYILVLIAAMVLSFMAGRFTYHPEQPEPVEVVKVDTVRMVRVDTIRDTLTRYVSERVIDTITIEVPKWVPGEPVKLTKVQRQYEGDNYRAWVSGCIDPALDSIYIERETIYNTVTITEKAKRKKWGVGVQCGATYDLREKRMAPYIGVGVSYNLFVF